ncbi:MAG: AAA family ATPase, partial [Candidatus Woesearchaeota archaeon]
MQEINKETILLFNPWWKTKKVNKELAKEFKREIFADILNRLDNRTITILYGLRRVGKSTLLFQIIEHLIAKIEVERIFYFSFDEQIDDLKRLINEYLFIHNLNLENGKFFFIFDEIQKLENWQNKIKIYYDLFPNIKFFLTGSSKLNITKKSADSLAGRVEFIKIEPLNYREWLALNNIKIDFKKIDLYKQELVMNLSKFIKTPFPEIANWKEDIKIKQYIDDFILARVLSFDMKLEYPDADFSLLNTLKNIFFENPGMILNIDNLANDLKRGKEKIIKHITY